MPAPALAADPLVSALTAAQRRIELEQARILTEPLAGSSSSSRYRTH